MKKIIAILTATHLLTSCVPLPAIFGGAAIGASVVAAKDSGSTVVRDTAISAGIKKDFLAKGFKDLYTKIAVFVEGGRVLYTGSVAKDEDIITAVDIAWEQKGVTEVINELAVSETSNYFDSAEYSRDSWITSRIKAKTIIQRDIKFINYTVITAKGVVYIFGVARSQEELDKVGAIASEITGVKKVVIHARVKEEV